MPTYSIGAEFLVQAETIDDARTLVSNFCDSFPNEVDGGDVIMQDATEVDD